MDNKKRYQSPAVDVDSLEGEALMLTISVDGENILPGGNSSTITPGEDGYITQARKSTTTCGPTKTNRRPQRNTLGRGARQPRRAPLLSSPPNVS